MLKPYLRPSLNLLIAIVLHLLSLDHQAVAFIQVQPCLTWSNSLSFHCFESLLKAGSNDGDEGTKDRELNNDLDFYRDLQRAKQEKLGGSIPPEQAKETAVQAEGDFLRAMRETKDEFQKAKDELGSDGAVDLFIERIREEDERNDEAQ